MNFIKKILTSHIWLAAALTVALVAIGSVLVTPLYQMPDLGSYTVSSGNVIESLDEPATVVAESKSGLSFQEAGKISKVYVKEGDSVATGQKLAILDTASLQAGLRQAQANLAAAQSNYKELLNGSTSPQIDVVHAAVDSAQTALDNANTTLIETTAQQNTIVANDYKALINTSFSAFPGSTNNDTVSVIISGVYSGNTEGNYDIRIVGTSQGLMYQASGLEFTSGAVQTQPNPLGSNGLYIQFSAMPSASDTWTIAIPNTHEASYVSNYNAYQAALKSKSSQIASAQAQVNSAKAALEQAKANLRLTTSPPRSEDIERQQAYVAQAQAAVASVQVALDNALLTAPFPGIVQNLTAQVGQVTSPNAPILLLVNNDGLKIQTYVSEADILKIRIGGVANVTLDAFGTEATFPATIIAVGSTETQMNGTPSFQVILHFNKTEPQVSDGMTGRVHITLSGKDNVVKIPSKFVFRDNNQYFVLMKTPSGAARKQVQIGSTSNDGMTEIVSGLSNNETLINF
jgi:RND family efflux transporter MFP subunit